MTLTHDELLALFRGGESDRVERKVDFATSKDKIAQNICAFANDLPGHNQPGVIFIGINDDGTCSNLPVTDDLLLQITDFYRDEKIVPFPIARVSRQQLDGCDLIVIEVEPSAVTPVYLKGKVFIRSGPSRREARREEESVLVAKRKYRSFDAAPIAAATLDDLDVAYVRDTYLPAAIDLGTLRDNDRPFEQQFTALGLLTRGTPTLVGLLIGAYDVRLFFPGAYIQFLRIDGVNLDDPVIDQAEIDGRVGDMLRRAFDKILAYNSVSLDLNDALMARNHPDYPVAALREALSNAVVHRDYETSNAPVRFYWHDDRVEIISPGGPFGQVNEANFGSSDNFDHRNP